MSKGTPAPHTVYDAVTEKTKTRHFNPDEAKLHRAILEHHEEVSARIAKQQRDHELLRAAQKDGEFGPEAMAALGRIVTGWPAGAG